MEIIDRELKYKNFHRETVTETVYFKELTASQRISLLKGMKIQRLPGDDKSTMEIDLGENSERDHRLIYMTLCDSNGKAIYTSLQKLQEEPESKVRALVKLAAEVHAKDDDSGNA